MRLAIELYFEGFPAPVQGEALVVRRVRTHLGIKYTRLEERDRARLAVLLLHHRRQPGAR